MSSRASRKSKAVFIDLTDDEVKPTVQVDLHVSRNAEEDDANDVWHGAEIEVIKEDYDNLPVLHLNSTDNSLKSHDKPGLHGGAESTESVVTKEVDSTIDLQDKHDEDSYENSPQLLEDSTGEFSLDEPLNFDTDGDVVDLLVNKSARDRSETDDEQLFNNLLLQFRRNPALVSRIKLQALQDLVVFPDDVKRLIKLVQTVLHVKNHFSVDRCPEQPLLEAFLKVHETDIPNLNDPSEAVDAWLQLVVFDKKSLYLSKPSLEELSNQQTVRYVSQQSLIAKDHECFGDPPPVSARSKPYQTKTLHEICRSSYRTILENGVKSASGLVRLGTPVRNYIFRDGQRVPGVYKFVSNQFEHSCINAEISPRHLKFLSGLEVLRVRDNEEVSRSPETSVSYESRVASFPVLEPIGFDGDAESARFTLTPTVPGEQLLVVGLKVDSGSDVLICRALDRISKAGLCTVTPAENAGHILRFLPEDLENVLTHLVPNQGEICKHVSYFEACYNIDDVQSKLNKYRLSADDLKSESVASIRMAITHNIMDYIETMKTVVDECLEVLKTQLAELSVKDYADISYFNDIDKDDGVKSWYDAEVIVPHTDIALLRELESSADQGNIYFYLRGTKWLTTESSKEIKAFSKSVSDEYAKSTRHHNGETSTPSLTVEDLASTHLNELLRRCRDSTRQHSIKTKAEMLKFFSDLQTEYSEVFDGSVFLRLQRALRLKRYRRTLAARSAVERAKADQPVVVKGFKLVDFETGESDVEYTTVMSIDGKLVDLSNRPPIDLEYLSVELRDSLSGQNSFPNPAKLFTTRPLIAIGNQLVVMMNPNKLGFVMSKEDFIEAVYDISGLFDELDDERFSRNSYIRDRLTPQTSKEELDQLRVAARQSFKDEIGSEVEVKTNRRCAIILARLLVELESHRPKHPFRKLFAMSGRKSLGRDEDTKYETYSEDNKINYVVQVASRPADLGDKGKLMQNTQADNLKNVGVWMAQVYDRLKRKPHIIAKYDSAAEADAKQEIIQTDAKRQGQLQGYDLLLQDAVSINDALSKALLNRLSKHEHTLDTFADSLARIEGDYVDTKSVMSALRQSIRFWTFVNLRDMQRVIESSVPVEQLHEASSNYNPDQYGEERGSGACKPNEVCILNTSADIRSASAHIVNQARQAEDLLTSLHISPQLFALRRKHTLSYVGTELKTLVTYHTSSVTVFGKADLNLYRRKSSLEVDRQDVLANIDKLCKLISRTSSRHTSSAWAADFAVKLSSSLGKLENVYEDKTYRASLLSAENIKHASPRQKYLTSVSLLKQFNLALRKHISLIRNGLSIRINRYVLTSKVDAQNGLGYMNEDQYDATISWRDLFNEKLQPSDVLYWNSLGETYLNNFRLLAQDLEEYTYAHPLHEVTDVVQDDVVSHAVASEVLLNILVDEMLSVVEHVVNKSKSDPADADSKASKVCDFCEDFVAWCLSQQAQQDKTLYDAHVTLSKLQEQETIRMSRLTKQQRDDLFMRQRAGLVVSYLDDEFGDERDPDQVGDDTAYEQPDGYDYNDEESKANVFMDDDY